ncbi:MAG: hypothetical protein QOG33_2363, partial [Gaiellales bacterium]|nr:hypothetical protein [Gaiellales bacterium]
FQQLPDTPKLTIGEPEGAVERLWRHGVQSA